jgi:hypothetical protein
MAFKTNMTNLQPRKQVYKREIQLLSRGFSAPQAWPNGKIIVFPWDSSIDQYLMEQTKISNNSLFFGLLERVCNLNGANVDQFVVSEIQSILLLSRALQYDGAMEYDSHCPFCNTVARETITIPDELQPVGQKPENYPGYDDIVLPGCKDVVRLRPLLVKDHKKIDELCRGEIGKAFNKRQLQILMPVMTINDGPPDNLDEINTWYEALSPSDAQYLQEMQVELTPHLDNRIPHRCGECQRTFHQILTFEQEFFRSGSGGNAKPSLEKNVHPGVGG